MGQLFCLGVLISQTSIATKLPKGSLNKTRAGFIDSTFLKRTADNFFETGNRNESLMGDKEGIYY